MPNSNPNKEFNESDYRWGAFYIVCIIVVVLIMASCTKSRIDIPAEPWIRNQDSVMRARIAEPVN